jgi:hypothetical protein
MIMKIAYLFSFVYWPHSPEKYILVYAQNEEAAREIGARKCFFNSGKMASPENLELVTYGL